MENDFSYEQLSPRAFEQLAVALAESVIGPGLEVYGPGPDGGREATFNGEIGWSNPAASGAKPGQDHVTDDNPWKGYTVVQAKQCQNPTNQSARDLRWLQQQIASELDAWMDPNSKRTQFPNYLLIVTNIGLTPADPGGTMSRLDAFLAERLRLAYDGAGPRRSLHGKGLREIRVWHRNKINNLLTNNASVRQRFAPLITVGDVIARLGQMPGTIPSEHISKLFVAHARTSLPTGRWIRFEDAGDQGRTRHEVDKLVVDLPVSSSSGPSTALKQCLQLGDGVMRRSLVYTPRLDKRAHRRHLVISGPAGNGKSTMTRYLAQVYRAAVCAHEDDEGPTSVESLIHDTFASLRRLKLDAPRVPRWPLRVDLSTLAEALGPDDDGPSVHRYLCDLISSRSDVPIHPHSLTEWLAAWPCVVFFDGLDEVAHGTLRHRVISEIAQFVRAADDVDADLFVIITTRPTGYTERILPEEFDQIDLAFFSNAQALDFAKHVTSARLADDEPEYRQGVLNKVEQAVHTPGVERLLRTPLQVLILSVIVANSGVLPTNRYRLFWTYFDTVFKREANKPTSFQTFLNTYRTEIEDIHLRVGLILHERCEDTGDVRARLPMGELRDIAIRRMREEDHAIPRANELAAQVVDVATRRLVLLAPDEDETVAFDVRSLQELMAGRALIEGPEEDVRHNLMVASRSPHWRNAWLFAAGELFMGDNHDRNLLLEIVETCDSDDESPAWLYPVGPELAADILDDGLAANKPRWIQRLVEVVLRCLVGPLPTEPANLARGLSAAAADPDQRMSLWERLIAGMSGDTAYRDVALALIHHTGFDDSLKGRLGERPKRSSEKWAISRSSTSGVTVSVGNLLRGAIWDKLANDNISERLQIVFAECNKLKLLDTPRGLKLLDVPSDFEPQTVLTIRNYQDEWDLFRLALAQIAPRDWLARLLLAQACGPAVSRAAISSKLRTFEGR